MKVLIQYRGKQALSQNTRYGLISPLFLPDYRGLDRFSVVISAAAVGYVPLADIGAEFLFQVISDRAERAAIIVTTN